MQLFCNLPIWIFSQPVAHILFVYTLIQFKVYLVTKKSSTSCSNCKRKNYLQKSFHLAKNWFLSTLEQFTVCRGDNQDHASTFDVMYWARNVTKKRVD